MAYPSRLNALWLALLLLAACGGATSIPTNTDGSQSAPTDPTATAPTQATSTNNSQAAATIVANTSEPTVAPTQTQPSTDGATAAPTIATAEADFTTPEGYHGLGRVDAPNTIVMYSDVF